MNFKKKQNHKIQKKARKKDILKYLYSLFEGRESLLAAFEIKSFQ